MAMPSPGMGDSKADRDTGQALSTVVAALNLDFHHPSLLPDPLCV